MARDEPTERDTCTHTHTHYNLLTAVSQSDNVHVSSGHRCSTIIIASLFIPVLSFSLYGKALCRRADGGEAGFTDDDSI